MNNIRQITNMVKEAVKLALQNFIQTITTHKRHIFNDLTYFIHFRICSFHENTSFSGNGKK